MEVRSPLSSREFQDYYALRWEILRRPLGMPPESARDVQDDWALHMAVFEEGRVVGVARLHRLDGEIGQIRYMAIDPGYAGKGIGRLLLQALLKEAARLEYREVVLNARKEAHSFYEKCGFTIQSDWFLQHNILHCRMGWQVRETPDS